MSEIITNMGIHFQYNDGGRRAAGYRGDTGDCACRAIAIVTGKPYAEIYAELIEWAATERRGKRKRGISHPRTGVYRRTMSRYLAHLGWHWTPTMGIGTGCRVHVRADELPGGRLILNLSKHYAAVVGGVLMDTHDCSRNGTRCVYGYWSE